MGGGVGGQAARATMERKGMDAASLASVDRSIADLLARETKARPPAVKPLTHHLVYSLSDSL